MRSVLFIFFLLTLWNRVFGTEVGPNKSYSLVHDYQDDWVVYDTRYKTNVPYVAEQHKDVRSHTVYIDIESNRNYSLLLWTQGDNFLFIDGALRQSLPSNTWFKMNVDSLYILNPKKEISITIFGSSSLTEKKVMMAYDKQAAKTEISKIREQLLIARPKVMFPYQNVLIMVSVIILLIFAFLVNSFNKQFNTLYSVNNLFSFQVREQSFNINTLFSTQMFSFVILLSFLIALLSVILYQNNRFFGFGGYFLQEGGTGGVFFMNFLKLSSMALVTLLLRYLMISLVGTVFKVDKIADVHFTKSVQASLLFYTILTPIITLLSINYVGVQIEWGIILKICIGFYFLRALIAYQTIERSLLVKKLYLFSYLCIVEVLPILIGIRYLY